MEVLFTGNTELLSTGFFEPFGPEYHNVVFCEEHVNNLDNLNKKKISVFHASDETGLDDVFTTFNFEKVVYLSQAVDGAVTVFDELEKLERTLYLCGKHRINQFLYLTTNDLLTEGDVEQKESSRMILLSACERLCQIFSQEYDTNFSIIKLPYIYSRHSANNQLLKWLEEVVLSGKLTFRGMAEQSTDFVCDEDLGELIRRIIDEPMSEAYQVLEIGGMNQLTLKEVEKHILDKFPETVVQYNNHVTCIPKACNNKIARKEYGWYPKHTVADDLDELIDKAKEVKKEKKRFFERKARLRSIEEKARIAAEMMLLFVLVELLNIWIGDNVILSFMDFRLIFVVLVGTMYGLTAGLVAALLASLGYVGTNIGDIQWQVLFYNVQNWLPFASYILLGAACGYTRDRHDDETLNAKEEHEILAKKYSFLTELYAKVLENKETYNSQIIGYRDSFGKLYAIVKRLNQVLPEQIFLEAVSVLEEALDSHSVAIYTINKKSDFARLNVCSKSLGDDFGRSLQLTKYPTMIEALRKDNVFINLDGLPEHPAYASPVYRDGEIVGMILIKYAKNQHMSMEFANKFNIITDLIRESLVRAMEYEERQERYVEGTVIIEPEAFKSILKVKKQMKEKQYLDYTLLRLEKGQRSLKELGDIINSMVRNTDTLGMDDNGEVFLLLSQTKAEDMDVVAGRLKKSNIAFEIIKG